MTSPSSNINIATSTLTTGSCQKGGAIYVTSTSTAVNLGLSTSTFN
jgi:hypothetical protein